MLAGLARGEISPPPGKYYASLVKRRLTRTEPSERARLDDVMNKLWNDSARMVGSRNLPKLRTPGPNSHNLWTRQRSLSQKRAKG